MTVNHVFTGVPVAEFGPAREWYERLFGCPPDLTPHDTEVAWRVAGDLCWVYVVQDRERAGNALLTILVDDLDALTADLAGRGIAVERAEPVGGMRRIVVHDPDRNRSPTRRRPDRNVLERPTHLHETANKTP